MPTPVPVDGIPIASWRMIGPWRYTPNTETLRKQADFGLSHDYLSELSQSEGKIGASEFESLLAQASTSRTPLHSFDIAVDSYTHILQLATVRRPVDYAVAYAGTILNSPVDQNIAISIGVDDSVKVWLNQELLHADTESTARGIAKVQIVVGAHLRKGHNFLLVKVGNKTGDWQLIVTLYPRSKALELANENAINALVENKVVLVGERISLRADLFKGVTGRIRLLNNRSGQEMLHTSIVLKRHIQIDPSPLEPDTLYRCEITAAGQTYEELFFYGNPKTTLNSYLVRGVQLSLKDRSKIDFDAQQERLAHLLLPENRATSFWDQKVVWCIHELEDMYGHLVRNEDPHKGIAGAHLRGYISDVDGSVQHYWIHVPQHALSGNNPIPLIIVMPYITGTNLPFLKSYYLAAYDEDERYRLLSDQFGVAVLQVWGRGNHLGDTSVGITEIFEALHAVEADYRIDRDRISLLGYCEGGRLALLLAEHYPDRFAGVAVEGPITAQRALFPYRRVWDSSVSPINMVEALVNIPVLIEHDGHDTTPIAGSVQFASKCKEAGGTVTLQEESGGFHGFYQDPTDIKRKLIAFLSDKKRLSLPRNFLVKTGSLKYAAAYWLKVTAVEDVTKLATVSASWDGRNRIDLRSDNVRSLDLVVGKLPVSIGSFLDVTWNGAPVFDQHVTAFDIPLTTRPTTQDPASLRKTDVTAGPLLDAFGGAFLVVVGRQGSPIEVAGMDRIAKEICKTWQAAYFADCPTRTDSQVTDNDLQTRNLILVGGPGNNSITARLAGGLPLFVSANEITIAGKNFSGDHLGYEMIYPNPLNTNRYIVSVGATKLGEVRPWNLHMSRDGVCDYFVVQLDGKSPDLLDAGYFDSQWSEAISILQASPSRSAQTGQILVGTAQN